MGKKNTVYPSKVALEAIKVIKGFNPRSDLGDLGGLEDSIKSQGVLQSLLVRPTDKEGVFELISGHRRFAVAKSLKLAEVPINVDESLADDTKALAAAMAENSDGTRSNLDPLDEAEGFKKLIDSDMSPKKIGTRVGVSDQHVRMTLRLLDVDPSIQKKVRKGEIKKSTAIALASLDAEMAKKVLPQVTEMTTEREIKEAANSIAKAERAEGKEVKVTKGKKGKGSGKKGVPTDGDLLAIWHTKKEVSEKIADLVEAIEQGKEKEQDVTGLQWALAALLWSKGEIEDIDTDTKEFKAAYKRAYDAIEWSEEEEGEEGDEDEGDDK